MTGGYFGYQLIPLISIIAEEKKQNPYREFYFIISFQGKNPALGPSEISYKAPDFFKFLSERKSFDIPYCVKEFGPAVLDPLGATFLENLSQG